MKSFLKLALLVTLGLSADIWQAFVNEEGEEFIGGAELAADFSKEPQRGGNGGSGWTEDCDAKGGLEKIGMKCGNYVGMLQLHCAKGKLTARGAGRGNGAGKEEELKNARGINKVIIAAGRYVDRVTFFRDGKEIKKCGRSRGGKKYTVKAPKGYELCGLKGRSGWWMDKLAAGWCKKPCAQEHCVFKQPPPDPTNFVKTPQKHDFNSRNKGDQIRKWFDGKKLAGGPDKIVGSVYYRDQGWGNKKTDVFFCCNFGTKTQSCVSLCGTNVRGWKLCKFDKPVGSKCKKGSTTTVAYKVGGGGGHRFYGKKFNGKVTYKSALLDALDITFDGLFVSVVEYANEQESSNYITNVAIGFGGLLAGLAGTFFMRRRQQSVEYSSLL